MTAAESKRFARLAFTCFTDWSESPDMIGNWAAHQRLIDERVPNYNSVALSRDDEVLVKRKKELVELTSRGDLRHDGANRRAVEEFVEWNKGRLPTEAEWEVAVRLTLNKDVRLLDLPSDLAYEWCADYYSYDYFFRTGGFADPNGPRHGRLSASQIDELTHPSGLRLLTKLKARDMRVVRQLPVDRRSFKGSAEIASFRIVVRPVVVRVD